MFDLDRRSLARKNIKEKRKEAKLIKPTATYVPFSMKNATTHVTGLLQYSLRKIVLIYKDKHSEGKSSEELKSQNFFRLLIFLIQPYMFRATNSSILRSTFLTVYKVFGIMYRHCCRPVPRLRWN